MPDNQPLVLNYATPRPVNRFVRMSMLTVVLLAIVVPGLSSSLIRGSMKRLICLLPIIPLAFLFFGPFWGEVLFRRSYPLSEWGLYPFLATCAVVEIVSVTLAIMDRNRALIGTGNNAGPGY